MKPSQKHISRLELKAVMVALHVFPFKCRTTSVQVMIDNATAVAIGRRQVILPSQADDSASENVELRLSSKKQVKSSLGQVIPFEARGFQLGIQSVSMGQSYLGVACK